MVRAVSYGCVALIMPCAATAINQKQGTAIGTLVHVPAADSILKSVHTMMLHRIHRICVMGNNYELSLSCSPDTYPPFLPF